MVVVSGWRVGAEQLLAAVEPGEVGLDAGEHGVVGEPFGGVVALALLAPAELEGEEQGAPLVVDHVDGVGRGRVRWRAAPW